MLLRFHRLAVAALVGARSRWPLRPEPRLDLTPRSRSFQRIKKPGTAPTSSIPMGTASSQHRARPTAGGGSPCRAGECPADDAAPRPPPAPSTHVQEHTIANSDRVSSQSADGKLLELSPELLGSIMVRTAPQPRRVRDLTATPPRRTTCPRSRPTAWSRRRSRARLSGRSLRRATCGRRCAWGRTFACPKRTWPTRPRRSAGGAWLPMLRPLLLLPPRVWLLLRGCRCCDRRSAHHPRVGPPSPPPPPGTTSASSRPAW